MQFYYILVGFAHGNKVLENALFNKNYIILEKKYYWADARYHDTNYLLCLYCGIRYHLKEKTIVG